MADANDSAAILAQVTQDLKELGYVSQKTTERMEAAEKATKDFEAKMALGGQAVTSLAKAGMEAAGAMYEGKKGASAFNSSVDSMADAAMAAGAALTLMIPGGPIIKAFVAGMTLAVGGMAKMYKASAEMADSLNTGFQKLSKSGGAASDGLMGIYGDLQKLGLGVQDLDGYVSMINDSSRDLALFGGSVFAGRKAFADIGKAMEPFREQLYNAGLTQEELNAGTMGFLRLQTRLGQAQNMTNQQLAEGAKKYLIEQDALTKLTGQSRQDREKEREAALSEQRFRAKVEEVRATQGEAAAERLIEANLLISSRSKEAGQAFRDLSTGMITTEAAQKGLISSNGELMRVSQAVIKGEMSAVEATQITGRSLGAFAKDMNMLAQAGVFNEIGIDFAQAVEMGLFANKDLAAELKKIKEESAKQGVDGGKAADKLQQAQTDLRLEQLKAMQSAQDFVSKGMLPATYAAIKMANATDNTVSALNKLVDTILKLVDDITNSSVVKYFTGANDRDKTSEEKEAQQRVEAAKIAYEKAFAGVGMFDPKRFRIGSSKEQDAADRELAMSQMEADRTRAKMNEKYGTTKQSAAAAGMPGTGTTAGPAGAPSGGMTAQDLASAGLEIRGHGDVQAPGQEVSPALIELAKKIQKSVPGFEYFSGFNDQFHNEKSPRSLHTQGLAADFVLGKKPSKEEGEHIVDLLKSLGASKAIDEYHSPSAKATGGHFHVEIPKFGDGGISTQPELAIVGEKGPEAHVPLKGGSIPVSINLGNDNAKKTTDIDSVLDSVERAFKNQEAARKQNVSISLSDATAGAYLFGTGNEFTGPQMDGLTTDMAALKDIAAKLGAYDAQNEIITNPNTWKEIIKSGMLQNYDVGMANIGSRMIGDDAGNILGERVKEVMEMNKVDVNTALTQTAKEFKDAMLQIVTQMQQQKDPELQAQMVEHLAAISRSGASTATASERLAQVASN
jgi:hypothetical protein